MFIHMFIFTRAFQSSIQVRKVFLLKLQKLFSPEQYVILCFYFIVYHINSVDSSVSSVAYIMLLSLKTDLI